MSDRPTYWQRLGEKLGRWREPFALVVLDLIDESPSGTQLFRVGWHRHEVTKVRIVGEERDIEPQQVVDSASP